MCELRHELRHELRQDLVRIVYIRVFVIVEVYIDFVVEVVRAWTHLLLKVQVHFVIDAGDQFPLDINDIVIERGRECHGRKFSSFEKDNAEAWGIYHSNRTHRVKFGFGHRILFYFFDQMQVSFYMLFGIHVKELRRGGSDVIEYAVESGR